MICLAIRSDIRCSMKNLMKFVFKHRPALNNKYILTILIFLVWMTFLDRHNFISRFQQQQKLNVAKAKIDYYDEQIQKVKQDTEELFTSHKSIEKFAREKYYMKKPDEDVFVVIGLDD